MRFENEKEKSSILLFLSCWIVYTVICMSKTNYTASIAFIVNEKIFTKADSGLISAAFYLLYGISQIFGGSIADKVSPYKIMTIGIVGSVITNLILAFTTNFWWVLILWSLTGLIQFGVWPAVSRIVAGILIPEHRIKASVYITLPIGIGGILSYLFVTSVLEAFGWSGVFIMNVILLAASLFLWKYTQKRTEQILVPEPKVTEKVTKKSDVKFMPLFFASGLFFIMLLGIVRALLDNGVKSWVPTMMMESYNLSPTWASMQTAILYICNILGVFLFVRLFRKIKNPVWVQTIYYLICLPACALMLFVGKLPAWVIFIMLVISTTAIYSMNNISVRIASAFEKYGYSGTVSGLINAVLCFGVVIANGGYGIIAEKFGWNAVTASWLFACVFAVILGIPAIFMWRKFTNKQVSKK